MDRQADPWTVPNQYISQLLKMLDGRMPEDACTASSPNESKATGKQKSFFWVALKMLTILNIAFYAFCYR